MKDLNLMMVFEALWLDRSVTSAATRLGVSQAAVSSSLKRLRDDYQDKLFTLVGRRMQPTPMAEAIAQSVLDALGLIRQTRVERKTFDPLTASRNFVIRTRDIGEVVCLPSVVKRLAMEAPELRIRTVFKPLDETVSGLAEGQIDLALGFLPALESNIHKRTLLKQNYVCVMRKGHPLADRPLGASQLLEYDHLLVETSGSGHLVLERALVDMGARKRITLRIPQYLSAPHFLIDSDLLWMAPAILADTLARHFPLQVVQLPIQLPDFEVALYWHERFHRDPANQWLRAFIADAMRG